MEPAERPDEPAPIADVAANIADVKRRIAKAAARSGRDGGSVNLIAVSKMQPDDRVDAALAAGQRTFGENRVQEAIERWGPRCDAFPDLSLHLIGGLQTNKVREAVDLFDVIESVDRPKLARALAREMDRQGRQVECLLQVNTGEEPQKSGVMPSDLDDLLGLARDELGLKVTGLMCIPPVDEPPSLHFAFLATLADRLGLGTVSMGMSGDFETAVRFGATQVRVGTAIFGSRPPAAGE